MPAKKKPYNRRQSNKNRPKRLGFKQRLLLFAALFGITGAALLYSTQAATPYASYPPHHAACVQNTPSKGFVRPGETFSATVRIKNDGTSTYSSQYGVFLTELNNGNLTNTWNARGTSLSSAVSPGGTATFNLTVTAPSAPSTYPFNWAMMIAVNGVIRNPCVGQSVTVMNPPAITLNANNQTANISVVRGSGLNLSWAASNNPGCNAFGNWSGTKTSQGVGNRSADTATSGTKTYNLTCSNQVGSATASRTVTVTNPPARPGGGGTPTPQPRPRPSTPNPGGSTNNPTPAAPDTTPPTAPLDFSAEIINDSSIQLTWSAAEDNIGVKGYQLERSTDQQTWTKLGDDPMTETTYTDKEGGSATTYHYRVRAVDNAGNYSGYIAAEATTNTFNANARNGEETFITSENGQVSASIPSGALDDDAQCVLTANNALLPPVKENHQSLAGPLELLCKTADGVTLNDFAKPVTINIKLSAAQKKQFHTLAYFVHGEEWQEAGTSPTKQVKGFELTEHTNFVIMGIAKKTPLWQKILLIVLILLVVVVGGFVLVALGIRFRRQQQLKAQARDYYNKEHGL